MIRSLFGKTSLSLYAVQMLCFMWFGWSQMRVYQQDIRDVQKKHNACTSATLAAAIEHGARQDLIVRDFLFYCGDISGIHLFKDGVSVIDSVGETKYDDQIGEKTFGRYKLIVQTVDNSVDIKSAQSQRLLTSFVYAFLAIFFWSSAVIYYLVLRPLQRLIEVAKKVQNEEVSFIVEDSEIGEISEITDIINELCKQRQ